MNDQRYKSYFVMKSDSHHNLAIAFSRNIWSTQAHNEKKISDAFQVSFVPADSNSFVSHPLILILDKRCDLNFFC